VKGPLDVSAFFNLNMGTARSLWAHSSFQWYGSCYRYLTYLFL